MEVKGVPNPRKYLWLPWGRQKKCGMTQPLSGLDAKTVEASALNLELG